MEHPGKGLLQIVAQIPPSASCRLCAATSLLVPSDQKQPEPSNGIGMPGQAGQGAEGNEQNFVEILVEINLD